MVLGLLLLAAACESDAAPVDEQRATTSDAKLYITSTVVVTDDGGNTYISALDSLDSQDVDLGQALEASGWTYIGASGGRLFVADGDLAMTRRYDVAGPGRLKESGKIDFTDYGAASAHSTFVSADKAYVFGDEITKWNPDTLEILGSFARADVDDKEDGMLFSNISAGRASVQREHRAFYAAHWANWDDYVVSEDSVIVVVDTDKDEIIDILDVPCPYLDFATIDEDGTAYFSNWTYSISGTLLQGKRKACAVRILAGEDHVDEGWSLTFADVTEGREAAALGYVGNRKAMISVFYDEDAEIGPDTTTETLADSTNWHSWLVDVDTLEASPVDGLGVNNGAYAPATVDGRSFVLIPEQDFATTAVYEISAAGEPELRWKTKGWSTELFELR